MRKAAAETMGESIRKSIRSTNSALLKEIEAAEKHDFAVPNTKGALETCRTFCTSRIATIETLVWNITKSLAEHEEINRRIADDDTRTAEEGKMKDIQELVDKALDAARNAVVGLSVNEREILLKLRPIEVSRTPPPSNGGGQFFAPASPNSAGGLGVQQPPAPVMGGGPANGGLAASPPPAPRSQLQQAVSTTPDGGGQMASFATEERGTYRPRLPRPELPTFDGKGEEWRQFIAIFRSLVDSTPLPEIEKLTILLGSLKGPAHSLIAGYAVTEGAYRDVLRTLHDEYGSEEKLVLRMHASLIDRAKAGESTVAAHGLIQDLQRITRQLRSMGDDVDNTHIEALIFKKLPRWLLEKVLQWKKTRRGIDVGELLDYCAEEVHVRRSVAEIDGTVQVKVNVTRTEATKPKDESKKKDKGGKEKKRIQCHFCEGEHRAIECDTYPTEEERIAVVKEKHLCSNCLWQHKTKDCKSKFSCSHCSKRHHTAICLAKKEKAKVNVAATTEDRVILLNKEATIINPANGRRMKVSVFLDSGAQRSFIREDVVKALDLTSIGQVSLGVETFGMATTEMLTELHSVDLLEADGRRRSLETCATPRITSEIGSVPTTEMAKTKPRVKYVTPQILIGGDYYWEIVKQTGERLPSGLYAVETTLGRIASGATLVNTIRTTTETRWTDEQLNEQLRTFFGLEGVGVTDDPHLTDNEAADKHFKETVTRRGDGRYVVSLPWKTEAPKLPSNRGLCVGQLTSVVKRLKETDRLTEYDAVIKEQIETGVLEEVKDDEPLGEVVCYLPHHPVIKDNKKSTKLRIVYNASAGSQPLNKHLLQGDSKIPHIAAMLLRMRTYEMVITADIRKAFHQVALQEKDRDALRLFWVRDLTKPVTETNLKTLRFTRVPFGVISSPYHLSAVIRHHLEQEESETAKEIVSNIYADNILLGAKTEEEARRKIKETIEMFDGACMPLREWTCNDEKIHKEYSDDPAAKETTFLGIHWSLATDELTIRTGG